MPDDHDDNREDPTRPAGRPVRISWLFGLVVGVVGAVVLGGLALSVAAGKSGAVGHPQAACGQTAPKLTVLGTGEATATPNVLTVVVQVAATEPSATLALAADNTKAQAAVTAFKSGGAEAQDVQTSNLSLQPQYSYPGGVPIVSGYQVISSISATLHNVSLSGAVIDAVVGVAGNAVQIESLSFSTRHSGAVEAQARARATAQAIAHARALARAAGGSLGPVCSVTDQSEVSVPENAAAGLPFASAAATPDVPIESGSQTQTAQVSMVYALAPARAHPAPR